YSASALPLSAGVYLPGPALPPPDCAFSDISAAARPMMRPWHRHLKLLQRFQPPRLALTWEQPRLRGRLAKDQNGASREGQRWISASLGSARWASPWPAAWSRRATASSYSTPRAKPWSVSPHSGRKPPAPPARAPVRSKP